MKNGLAYFTSASVTSHPQSLPSNIRLANDKGSSLFYRSISDKEKRFVNIDPRASTLHPLLEGEEAGARALIEISTSDGVGQNGRRSINNRSTDSPDLARGMPNDASMR